MVLCCGVFRCPHAKCETLHAGASAAWCIMVVAAAPVDTDKQLPGEDGQQLVPASGLARRTLRSLKRRSVIAEQEELDLQPGQRFLDVGSGCGIITACGAFLVRPFPAVSLPFLTPLLSGLQPCCPCWRAAYSSLRAGTAAAVKC